jgi:isopenicillin-N epimerase
MIDTLLEPLRVRHYWQLDPEIVFLNHGSFGACPLPVMARQQALRDQLEREPVRFMAQELEPLLDEARAALASFVGAEPHNLVFVPNATTGVNSVLRSLQFAPDDELLTTNHEYNASRNALDFAAARAGAKVVVVDVPFPIEREDQIIQTVLQGVTPRTRLVLLDHVTSQTALVFPIAQLIRALESQGIPVLVDGAHAPGMVPLHLESLGASYYTGNCHKWMCAPKGAAFLYARPDRQEELRPVVISHGANSPRRAGIAPPEKARSLFHLEFDWMGTHDPTAYLAIPTAIAFMESLLPGGWPALMERNHHTAVRARESLCAALGSIPPCPDAMLGSMAIVPVTDGEAEPLQDCLFQEFQIEVPVIPWHMSPNRLVRISAQIYNTVEDYAALETALLSALSRIS